MVDVTGKNLNIRLTSAENITAYLCGGNLQVVFGKNAEMKTSQAVQFIASGAKEIENVVANGVEIFNDNAERKTVDFNDNADAKGKDFDDNAAKAIAEAQNWAHQAEVSASSMAKRDLSNLTALGEAKFSAKQDVILDLVTIRNGAALGSTALQSITSSDVTTALGYTPYNSSNPSGYITSSALTPYVLSADLATVATSGSYNDLSNKPTIPTVNNPTITFTQGGTTKGTITLNQSTNQTVALDSGGSARNIGEIVESTIPLTDAGLHLLDGSLIQGDGIYSEFVSFIAGLVNTYPDVFETEANWQTSVTNYGVCGKFVYDSVNNTVRLPKITGFIEGTNTLANLGALTAAGLPIPNISMPTTGSGDNNSQWHKAALMNDGGSLSRGGLDNDNWVIQTLNANNSTIYGNSSTVQPQSIKTLYYICIATSTKTDIEVDIDEIATDLNGKVDIDLSNINPTSAKKAEITSWGMPDYTSGVSKSANVDYTADSNGFIIAVPTAQSGSSRLKIKIDDIEFMFFQGYTNTDYEHLNIGCIPIAKNSTYRITLLSGCNVRFFPCIGG